MQFTFHATRRTPHGGSTLEQAMCAWLVKTRRAPSRHSRDERVYGQTTMAVHKLRTPPPPRCYPTPPGFPRGCGRRHSRGRHNHIHRTPIRRHGRQSRHRALHKRGRFPPSRLPNTRLPRHPNGGFGRSRVRPSRELKHSKPRIALRVGGRGGREVGYASGPKWAGGGAAGNSRREDRSHPGGMCCGVCRGKDGGGARAAGFVPVDEEERRGRRARIHQVCVGLSGLRCVFFFWIVANYKCFPGFRCYLALDRSLSRVQVG